MPKKSKPKKRGRKKINYKKINGFKIYTRKYGVRSQKSKKKGKFIVFEKKGKKTSLPYNPEEIINFGIDAYVRTSKNMIGKKKRLKNYTDELQKQKDAIQKLYEKRRKQLEKRTETFIAGRPSIQQVLPQGTNKVQTTIDNNISGDRQGQTYRELLRPIVRHDKLMNDIISDYGPEKFKKYLQYHLIWEGNENGKERIIDDVHDGYKTIQEIIQEYNIPKIMKGDTLTAEPANDYINEIGQYIDKQTLKPFYYETGLNHRSKSGLINEIKLYITFSRDEINNG